MKDGKDHRPKEKRVSLLTPSRATGSGAMAAGDSGKADDKQDQNKEKKEVLSKVVIRRLPPTLTKEQLLAHLHPLPDHDYFEFFSNDTSLYPHTYSRAYINFKNQQDILLFRDRFDRYIFLDSQGQEYPAIVEFAPFQKAAKKKIKKRDNKVGTIDDDPEYRKFLENYATDEKMTSTPETLLEEIEAKNRELITKKTTPLLSFLKNKQRMREEKREERRRREIERKRQREEERRKWKEEDKQKRKDIEKLKKLLKKPEKSEKEMDRRDKSMKLDKENLNDDRGIGVACTLPRRSDVEFKDERFRRMEDECGRDNRERDRDYERDQDRNFWERERQRRQEEEQCRRQKERAFKRKEEEMRKEKDLLRDKGKKAEATETLSSLEKLEKKDEVIKRDRIRNKDRPAMQLYQPGARSRNRLCPPDDSTRPGDSTLEKKQESGISHRKEGGGE
ncbi:regulator of nonsense transcripts 3B-like [Erinaceus europaeus]|uniref:Regulator of nonsense transcripts 3B-like n=1 Tax=Erinaceus europaeus TaxID=9365 RepID=A0ABM3X0R6_ERIEU|nr:regulator of nonsense transcripts 3B-like [Erinaceus europaeus]